MADELSINAIITYAQGTAGGVTTARQATATIDKSSTDYTSSIGSVSTTYAQLDPYSTGYVLVRNLSTTATLAVSADGATDDFSIPPEGLLLVHVTAELWLKASTGTVSYEYSWFPLS